MKRKSSAHHRRHTMDADWPTNPTNGIICILCKAEVHFYRGDPEIYFRHLISEHCAFYNLNLLLELSLAQPGSVSQETRQTRQRRVKQEPAVTDVWGYKGR